MLPQEVRRGHYDGGFIRVKRVALICLVSTSVLQNWPNGANDRLAVFATRVFRGGCVPSLHNSALLPRAGRAVDFVRRRVVPNQIRFTVVDSSPVAAGAEFTRLRGVADLRQQT